MSHTNAANSPESLHLHLAAELRLAAAAWNSGGDPFIGDEAATSPYARRGALMHTAMSIHWANHTVWHHENHCRTGLPAAMAVHKPGIDRHNQLRNDRIEVLDSAMAAWQRSDRLPLEACSPETYGSMADRASIAALKEHHWGLLAAGDPAHAARHALAAAQFGFLVAQMGALAAGMAAGTRCMRPFRQLKMYNDRATNPMLADGYFGCGHCGVGQRPALEHGRGCPVRLSFFGGDPSWDTSAGQHELEGQRYRWDAAMGTWVPEPSRSDMEERLR